MALSFATFFGFEEYRLRSVLLHFFLAVKFRIDLGPIPDRSPQNDPRPRGRGRLLDTRNIENSINSFREGYVFIYEKYGDSIKSIREE